MIWHIFRKDARLLWPMALAVMLVQVLCAGRTLWLGHFYQPLALANLTAFLPYLVYLGIVLVTIAVVHQDVLAGDRQDWLTRPVHRQDLLLSKLLFVLLMLLGPIFLVDVAEQLAVGFTLSSSLKAAAVHGGKLLILFALPALMLGAVSRSVTDAFAFGIAAAIGFTLLFPLALVATTPGQLMSGTPGMMWIAGLATSLVLVIGALATLAYQYAYRRTLFARCMGLLVVLMAFATFGTLPNALVLRVQRSVWGASFGGPGIALSFAPETPSAPLKTRDSFGYNDGMGQGPPPLALQEQRRELEKKQLAEVELPLRISGLSRGDILYADQVDVRVIGSNGSVYYAGTQACYRWGNAVGTVCSHFQLEARAQRDPKVATLSLQHLKLPIAVYDQIKEKPVRLVITYAFTRFAEQPSETINASGGLRHLPELGSCATQIDDDGDEIELRCLTNVGVPSCASAVLEDPHSNSSNPELHRCDPSYAPFAAEGIEDVVGRSGINFPFRDLTGLAHYPVNGANIGQARIRITTYDPADHFQRLLVIPSIRLADWESSKAPPARQTPGD
jgi:hypothetical protein